MSEYRDEKCADVDYSKSGKSIQYAMLEHAKRFPDISTRPSWIRWGHLLVKTGDSISVPERGTWRGEFLRLSPELEQGFDVQVAGWTQLPSGKRVDLLRTWGDERLASVVEYPYYSKDCLLWVWNVYKRRRGAAEVEERWTGNAGFWVEEISDVERVYHCSHATADPPEFEGFVFKLTIIGSAPT
jgi:hypothetical protein